MNKFIRHKRRTAFKLLQDTIFMNSPTIALEAIRNDVVPLNNRGANHLLKKVKLIHDKLKLESCPLQANAAREADILFSVELFSTIAYNSHVGAAMGDIIYAQVPTTIEDSQVLDCSAWTGPGIALVNSSEEVVDSINTLTSACRAVNTLRCGLNQIHDSNEIPHVFAIPGENSEDAILPAYSRNADAHMPILVASSPMLQQMQRVLAARKVSRNQHLDKVNHWRSLAIDVLESICSGPGKVDKVFVNMLNILKQLEKRFRR